MFDTGAYEADYRWFFVVICVTDLSFQGGQRRFACPPFCRGAELDCGTVDNQVLNDI